MSTAYFHLLLFPRIAFFNEFEPINPKLSMKKQSDDLREGTPFEPRCVYDVLPVLKTSLSEKVSIYSIFKLHYNIFI